MLAVCVSSLFAEHGDIDQVRLHLPDLGIDAGEADPLVEPVADPVIAGVGSKVREAADEFASITYPAC